MNVGKTVFAQILEHLPRYDLHSTPFFRMIQVFFEGTTIFLT